MNSSSALWCLCLFIIVHCTSGFIQAGAQIAASSSSRQRHIAASSSSSFAASVRPAATQKRIRARREQHTLTCSIWQDLTEQIIITSTEQAVHTYNTMLTAHPWQVDELTACSIYSISDVVGKCCTNSTTFITGVITSCCIVSIGHILAIRAPTFIRSSESLATDKL
jgi:hypothetical protein